MTLERIEHKVFASEAPLDEMGQFGSALATTKLNTKDVAEIQALPAYTKGWGSAIISENNYPAMEEMNGVLNVMSYHTGYLYQEGVPVYSPSQTYSATSWVKNITGEKIYRSKQDENMGNDLEDSAWWEELKLGGGAGLQLFDTILKDHILTYEESKGLALQGTYVYKDAIAGSRYGYPDFYAKCLEEYENCSESDIVINNGQSVSNVVLGDTWEIVEKFTVQEGFDNSSRITLLTASSVDSSAYISVTYNSTGMRLNLRSDDGTYIEDSHSLTFTPTVGETYIIKLSYDGTFYKVDMSYNNGETFTNKFIVESTLKITSLSKISFGALYTTIHQNETYIINNNNKVWVYTGKNMIMKHPNGHMFYHISQKESIDDILDTYGTAWFYGVDTENERIYLPRNNYFEQTTGEISEVGQSVEAGLPNITGSFPAEILNKESLVSGAFYYTGEEIDGSGGTGDDYKVGFDASRCSSVYGNSDTVQPNAVKKLLYICVGNTETISSITDVVDVTTTENDTTPLFTGMYFEFTPNNVSWLKAGEQANSAGIYTTCYNELVNELVSPKYGLKVINESDMIVGIDYSEYWKVNQDDMTFTTPTRISYLPISADSAKVYGDGNGLVLSDGTNYQTMSAAYAGGGLSYTSYGYGGNNTGMNYPIGTVGSPASDGHFADNTVFGIAPKSILPNDMTAGLVADLSSAKSTTAQLYFKVANAVQNLELLDAGEVLESLADKISRQDCKAYIIESYVNGESGYNIYSNGYVEQWGIIPASTTNITFLKEFLNAQYSIVITYLDATSDLSIQVRYVSAVRATTGFKTQSSDLKRAWQACGYIA